MASIHLTHQLLNPPKKFSLYSLETRPVGFKSLYDQKSFDQLDARLKTFIFAKEELFDKRYELANNGFYYNARNEQLKCSSCKAMLKEHENYENSHDTNCTYFLYDPEANNEYSTDEETDEPINFKVIENVTKKHQQLKGKASEQSANTCTNFKNEITKKHSENTRKSAKSLMQENQKLKDEMICRNCKSEKVQTLLLPCRHLVTCEACADKLDLCVRCNAKILGTVRTYLV